MESYVVGFKLFDAKALQTEDGGPCDPFVVVQCAGCQWSTEILEARQQLASFNSGCTWPSVPLNPRQFESGYIEFKVYARNWFTRNFLIGSASLQLSYINKRENYLYARKWLCLRRDGDPAITGMLNVSVFALRPGQQAPSATLQEQSQSAAEEEQEDEEDALSKAVLKNEVEAPAGKAHHLEINIHRVQDLATTQGVMGEVKPSPYVTVEFAGCLLKTGEKENMANCTFNEKMLIPVVTPVYEDTIILKLWNYLPLGSDELMAQGLISFSELRNNALPPRWFNLYGWCSEELPNMDELVSSGVDLEPNFFKGRMLVSGRVEPLEPDDDLKPAGVTVARSVPEPNVKQVALMADVYCVQGCEGHSLEVELSFGATSAKTRRVYQDKSKRPKWTAGEDDEDDGPQTSLDVPTFTFSEAAGRIPATFVVTTEEVESQPFIMINVYAYDFLGYKRRVGFCMRKIVDMPTYTPGNPCKPTFWAMEPMPGRKDAQSASVLLNIERSSSGNLVRHARKAVKPMLYVVRAYCLAARRVQGSGPDTTFALQASCAGASKETTAQPGPRPKFMQHLDLHVMLYSDSPKNPPSMEPITLSLKLKQGATAKVIATASCLYTHMRQKDHIGNWEPYAMVPQWVRLAGGKYGSTVAGEALVAFELLLSKFRDVPQLQPRDMHPAVEEEFDESRHFCKLRKATCHFSLHGLRDLRPLQGGLNQWEIRKPVVEVGVQYGDTNDEPENRDVMRFVYEDTVEGGDKRLKSDSLCNWKSEISPGVLCSNFEFLQVQKIKVLVPDKMILQPYVYIRVYEEPSRLADAGLGSLAENMGFTRTLIGESRQSLADLLPCCWFPGVSPDMRVRDQRAQLESAMAQAKEEARVHNQFRQKTEDELMQFRKQHRTADDKAGGRSALSQELEQLTCKEEYVDSTALPKEIRESRANGKRRFLDVAMDAVNRDTFANFGDRVGAFAAGVSSVKVVQGKLEDQPRDGDTFCNDFWYRNRPLLMHRDDLSSAEAEKHWDFLEETRGFVKCTFKLVTGWGDSDASDSDVEPASGAAPVSGEEAMEREDARKAAAAEAMQKRANLARIRRSFGVDDKLDEYAFDQKKMRKRFKAVENVPSRVRVRLYLVKAVCIYGKNEQFPEPYVEFQYGDQESISMRSNALVSTNEPDFYMVDERDIVLPEDSRLEVRVNARSSAFEYAYKGDANIGSTVIDLEDRWHSPNWRNSCDASEVPKENRPMCARDAPGVNRGALDMWVEMLDAEKASDIKASPLVKPPEVELEVRLIIWKTKQVKLMIDDDYTNVMISTSLDCGEYCGKYPKLQETDVHYSCSDGNAIFNWRMVYERIKCPVKKCSVKMDLFHVGTISHTFIGSLDLDVKRYIERVAQNQDAIDLSPDWLYFSNPELQDAGDDIIGAAEVQMQVWTQAEANTKRAGKGREEPNDHPRLTAPSEGRDWGALLSKIGFSLPDFGMWKKMLPLFVIMLLFLFGVIILKQMGLL